MNQLGPWIGSGILKGKGPVEVYATTKDNRVDCLTQRNELVRVNKERVAFVGRQERKP